MSRSENKGPCFRRHKNNVILARHLLFGVYSMSFARKIKHPKIKVKKSGSLKRSERLKRRKKTFEKLVFHDIRLNQNSHFRFRFYLRILYRLLSLINWNILSGLTTELAICRPLRLDSEHHALYLRIRLPFFCNERYDFRFSVFKVHVYAPQTLRVSLHGRFLHDAQVFYLLLCGIYQFARRCERRHS